jgi:thioredoxin-related protein
MKKAVLIGMLGLFGSLSMSAQSLNWTHFEDLEDSLRRERRPLLLFVQADWCAYCKMQMAQTFSQKALIEKLNRDFYCLKLDAEEKKDLAFFKRTYRFQATGPGTGKHELALMLGAAKGLPTTVIFDRSWQVVQRWNEFVSESELQGALEKF